MSRSKWKGNFVDNFFFRKDSLLNLYVWSRRSVILPEFVGYSFFVYNGKTFSKILVTQAMVGYKFGEFVLTKKIGSKIHNKKTN